MDALGAVEERKDHLVSGGPSFAGYSNYPVARGREAPVRSNMPSAPLPPSRFLEYPLQKSAPGVMDAVVQLEEERIAADVEKSAKNRWLGSHLATGIYRVAHEWKRPKAVQSVITLWHLLDRVRGSYKKDGQTLKHEGVQKIMTFADERYVSIGGDIQGGSRI
jgi:hypothetical protein